MQSVWVHHFVIPRSSVVLVGSFANYRWTCCRIVTSGRDSRNPSIPAGLNSATLRSSCLKCGKRVRVARILLSYSIPSPIFIWVIRWKTSGNIPLAIRFNKFVGSRIALGGSKPNLTEIFRESFLMWIGPSSESNSASSSFSNRNNDWLAAYQLSATAISATSRSSELIRNVRMRIAFKLAG